MILFLEKKLVYDGTTNAKQGIDNDPMLQP
jgi:hypothetical protein